MVFERYPNREEIRLFQAGLKQTLQEQMAAKRFWGGFALLPWLWLINVIHFRSAFWEEAPEYAKIRYYTRASLVGVALALPMFLAWVLTYHENWTNWGAFGEDLSLITPKGA